jgi:hypothetical protein
MNILKNPEHTCVVRASFSQQHASSSPKVLRESHVSSVNHPLKRIVKPVIKLMAAVFLVVTIQCKSR